MKPIFLSITGYSILVAEMSNIENMDCINIEFNGFSGSLYSCIVIAIVIIIRKQRNHFMLINLFVCLATNGTNIFFV